MIKTYTYKIKADRSFIDKFNQWLGICRFLYNCALEMKIDAYKRCNKNISNYEIQKELTGCKADFDWLEQVHSQTCNACGFVDKRNRISQSEFVCVNCGSIFNADENASINIKSRGTALIRQREALACA